MRHPHSRLSQQESSLGLEDPPLSSSPGFLNLFVAFGKLKTKPKTTTLNVHAAAQTSNSRD